MKFTLSWLKDYLDTSAPSHVTDTQIIEKLTELGLEVEEVENNAEIYAPFKTCKVMSAEQHPDADRLRVCQVETDNGMVQVVCGAPNAKTGMTGIFASVGAHIPGLDITLEKGKIRGQDSCGMLVSEREMKISDEHNGIIELDGDYAIGTPITDIFDGLDDVTIEIGLTPNRPDCAGISGIARDLAAAGCGQFKMPDRTDIPEKFKSTIGVHTDTPDTCPHFMGRMVKGVKNGESPDWLKQKLESIGLRPISILVDITNYFCIGLNRPLHVYDANLVKGDIRVRMAKAGESFDALNDKSYTLNGGETVITDDNGVLGLGGIVGGTSTGCEMDTKDVFIECAYFDPTHTATTGRVHQIITDARYRFERGIDPEFTAYGLDLATQMVIDLCGGAASDSVEAGKPIQWQRTYKFSTASTKRLTGVDIPPQEQLHILGSLGFKVGGEKEPYDIQPPSWRPDVLGAPDLVEEIIRVYGYDKIEASSLKRDTILTENALSNDHILRYNAGRTLANRGLQECVTWSFMPYNLATQFNNDTPVFDGLRLTNPISVEMDTMRPSILPNLIQAAARNADKGYPNAALFEVGPIFNGVEADDQPIVCAGVRHGVQGEKHWASTDISRTVDAYDAKADALAAIVAINPTLKPQLSPEGAPSHFHPGRSGVLRLGKNVLGVFGEIHPMILETIDITGPLVGFEIFLKNIPMSKSKSAAKPALSLSPLQPIAKDFAFLVDENVNADTVINAVNKGAGKLLSDARIFDIYQGQGVPEGQKSIAVAVTWVPSEKTLTDKDIESLMQSVIQEVTNKTGATLRA